MLQPSVLIALSVHSQRIYFSLCTLRLFLCWIEMTQSARLRPGIFLCPSSPILSTDSLSLPGSGTLGSGHCSGLRATTPPLPASTHSDSALLRKSVSFTEDLLNLAASGIVGLLCVIQYPNPCSHKLVGSLYLRGSGWTVRTPLFLSLSAGTIKPKVPWTFCETAVLGFPASKCGQSEQNKNDYFN